MIYLEDHHLEIIEKILLKHPYSFCAFGSRVRGNHKPFSDLDLCAMENIPELAKCYLDEAFEESDLPFKVDIIEWNKISKDFQALIKDDLVPISTKIE